LGWTGLAVLGIDRYLQHQQRKEARESVEAIALESEEKRRELLAEWADKAAVGRARIQRRYKSLGGSHGLRDVRVGDAVEILERNVGPDRHYHVCRHRRTAEGGATGQEMVQVGWYPIQFMMEEEQEKTENAAASSVWKRWLLFWR
jgi:hypothetical protein